VTAGVSHCPERRPPTSCVSILPECPDKGDRAFDPFGTNVRIDSVISCVAIRASLRQSRRVETHAPIHLKLRPGIEKTLRRVVFSAREKRCTIITTSAPTAIREWPFVVRKLDAQKSGLSASQLPCDGFPACLNREICGTPRARHTRVVQSSPGRIPTFTP